MQADIGAVVAMLALAASDLAAQTPARPAGVTAADLTAALRATNSFTPRGGKWVDAESGQCEAFIEPRGVRDLNGDGKPEIVVTASGGSCYGNTGQGFYLMQKTSAGAWRSVYASHGIPEFQTTKGAGGWVDIEVGGPGFCFPILRFNGKTYAPHRTKEYQPGACRGR